MNMLIVQGGGPSPVFNRSLVSSIRKAKSTLKVKNIFGAMNGIEGLARGDTKKLNGLSEVELNRIAHSPGAVLGSSRMEPDESQLKASVSNLKELGIECALFMGGNGTMEGAADYARFCRSVNYSLQVVGVPKTIDNDIAVTDRCPGFASAARYIAQTTLDLAADLRSLPGSISILETLGRDSGWLAASTLLAKRADEDAPHLIYLPESPFHTDGFLSAVQSAHRQYGWVMVTVAEGLRFANGHRVFEQKLSPKGRAEERPLIGGVAQHLASIVGERLGLRCRNEKPGLIGRSCISQVAEMDRADADLVGEAGVQALVDGKWDVMIALSPRTPDEPAKTFLVSLSKVKGQKRPIPKAWLGSELGVDKTFLNYVTPLVGELSFPVNPLSS